MSESPRRSLPIPLPVELAMKEGDGRFFGYLQNVSVTGAFVQSCAPRAPGTSVSIRLRLPGLAVPLECPDVEVVWSRSYQGRGGPAPGMGVRLRRLSAAARAEIRRFCAASEPSSVARDAAAVAASPPARGDAPRAGASTAAAPPVPSDAVPAPLAPELQAPER